jgi:hypothetical protein
MALNYLPLGDTWSADPDPRCEVRVRVRDGEPIARMT